MIAATEWSPLETAKLFISVLTPLLLVALGVIINQAGKRVEHSQWVNRKLVERRLELHEQMAPKLNDIFCFFNLVGSFQDITPPMAIDLKRQLDKLFYTNKYLFSEGFGRDYLNLMDTCFEMFVATGQDARLRTPKDWHRDERTHRWKEEWAQCFSGYEKVSAPEAINDAYERLMMSFAEELGAAASPTH